jgi:hypothetical protein
MIPGITVVVELLVIVFAGCVRVTGENITLEVK